MTDNIKNISVTLAGRTYPIVATIDEEETIKQINGQLDKEFTTMRQQYANKLNKQDILAMMLFTYARKLHDSQKELDTRGVESRINAIENILEQAFEK